MNRVNLWIDRHLLLTVSLIYVTFSLLVFLIGGIGLGIGYSLVYGYYLIAGFDCKLSVLEWLAFGMVWGLMLFLGVTLDSPLLGFVGAGLFTAMFHARYKLESI